MASSIRKIMISAAAAVALSAPAKADTDLGSLFGDARRAIVGTADQAEQTSADRPSGPDFTLPNIDQVQETILNVVGKASELLTGGYAEQIYTFPYAIIDAAQAAILAITNRVKENLGIRPPDQGITPNLLKNDQ